MSMDAIQRLWRARNYLDEMRQAKDAEEAKTAFEHGLDEARSAFQLVERATLGSQGAGDQKKNCRTWWKEEKDRAYADPLIDWAWKWRNTKHHGGQPAAMRFQTRIGQLNTGDVIRPKGWENASLGIGSTGVWLILDRGTTRERRMRAPMRAEAPHPVAGFTLSINNAPSEHAGKPIPADTRIDGLLELIIEWTQDVLDRAVAEWG